MGLEVKTRVIKRNGEEVDFRGEDCECDQKSE